jgi:hypothetical protein
VQSARAQAPDATSLNWARAGWGIIAAGVALRVATGFQSFWLDEIWSYYLAQDLESVWQVFTERRHDNNHVLNTLYIAAVGQHESGFAYRGLSLTSGSASLLLLGRIAARGGRAEWLAVLVLAAFSYPLVVASAQARGYAPAIFFALLALDWARPEAAHRLRSGWAAVVFWTICAFGFLSHLTFVYAYAGILAWTASRAWRAADTSERVGWLRWHSVPVAMLVALYLGFYSELVIGGGDRDYDVAQVVSGVLGSAWVARSSGVLLLPAALLTLVVAVLAFGSLRGRREQFWIFLVCAVALVPAAVIFATPRLLYPRYFWASVPYLYLLAGLVLGALFARGGVGRALYAVVLIAFAVTHTARSVEHIGMGQTNYADTLAYLETHTEGDLISLSTDHDFRNSMVLRYYARYSQKPKTMAIRTRGSWVGAGPQWYLSHSWLAGRNPPEKLELEGGRHFTRVARFDHGIGYGWTWFVYRNDALP